MPCAPPWAPEAATADEPLTPCLPAAAPASAAADCAAEADGLALADAPAADEARAALLGGWDLPLADVALAGCPALLA